MRLTRTALTLGILAALVVTIWAHRVHAQENAAVAHARQVVDLLRAERFEEVTKEFNTQMAAALSAAQLRDVWSTLRQQVGAFTAYLDQSATAQPGGLMAVVLGCQFEKAALNAIVAFDSQQKIAGLRFVPRLAAAAEAPAPQVVGRFKEEAVTVGAGEWALPGTLTLPSGAIMAAAVLVHGSGPSDRDATIGPNKPFRDIAWGLAERGVAVLRYEKRTLQHRSRMATIPNLTVREAVIDDARLAVALLRGRHEIDPTRIFVIGLSLGGTLAPRIAAADRSLAGIVIMAGATRPLMENAREQLLYLGSFDPEQGLQALRTMAPESYWKDLDAYQPAQVAATLSVPMLILQGERDYQVTMADLQGWREALEGRSDVTIKSYPVLNHLFMAGEGKSTPGEYFVAGRVATIVIDDIARWMSSV